MTGAATSQIRVANSTVRSNSWVCATTSVTRPIFSARVALMTSPVIESRGPSRSRHPGHPRDHASTGQYSIRARVREYRSVGRHKEVATECHLQVQLVERGKGCPMLSRMSDTASAEPSPPTRRRQSEANPS
jgi:hypothetical protein